MQTIKAFGKTIVYRPHMLKPATAVGKAHITQHLRRTKSGRIVSVREHEDSRKYTAGNQQRPMSLKQGNYIYDLLGFSQFREIKKEFLKHFDPDTGKTDLSSVIASRLINAVNDYYGNPKKGKIELLRIQRQF